MRTEPVAPPAPGGVIAIIRLRTIAAPDDLLRALLDGGIRAVEVTYPTPGSLETVRRWAGHAEVGVGTVRTDREAAEAIDAGARFLVTPTTVPDVLRRAAAARVPAVCGALTPTEIDHAWHLGAAAVKVFPIDALNGPAYIRGLLGPLPDVPLVPTGGIDTSATRAYAALGCAGVGVGSALVEETMVTLNAWPALTARARAFAAAWREGTEAIGSRP